MTRGYPKGTPRGESSPRRDLARKMKSAGMTYLQIGNELGVSRQRAQQLVSPTKLAKDDFIKQHNDKCDHCGATGVKLDAHHSDYAAGPSELLCVACHRGETAAKLPQSEHIRRAAQLPEIIAALAQAKRERDLSIMARLAELK